MEKKTLETKICKKGEIIFKEGEYAACMYDIIMGQVAIYKNYGTPQEKLLTTLQDGECFGEMGMLEAIPRSATVVATEKTLLRVITTDSFGAFFQEQPARVLQIMQHMSHRMRELTADYMEACGTIAEYLEAEEKNQPKSDSLLSRMKRFVGVYHFFR